MPKPDPLKQERETATRMFDQLFAAFPNKWAVFKGDGVAGFFDTFEEVMEFGYRRYRSQLFLAVELSEEPADDEDDEQEFVVGGTGDRHA